MLSQGFIYTISYIIYHCKLFTFFIKKINQNAIYINTKTIRTYQLLLE